MITFDKTTVICIILIVAQVAVLIYFFMRNRKKKKLVAEQSETPEKAYAALRNLALQVTPSQLKLAIPNKDLFIYGMVMDWNMGDVIVTLTAYITGACSMYLSTGGGFVKGGQNPDVAELAVEFVTAAKEYIDHAIPTETTSVPEANVVRFFFLTNHRMYGVDEQMANFDNNSSLLLPFFEKANEVISGMRSSGSGALAN
jgi:hypothetical protein